MAMRWRGCIVRQMLGAETLCASCSVCHRRTRFNHC